MTIKHSIRHYSQLPQFKPTPIALSKTHLYYYYHRSRPLSRAPRQHQAHFIQSHTHRSTDRLGESRQQAAGGRRQGAGGTGGSPFQGGAIREVFGDEWIVVCPQLLDGLVQASLVLGVQIVLVELQHPVQILRVLVIHELSVCSPGVPWVGRVVANHCQTGGRNGAAVSDLRNKNEYKG